ncbi:uncharacterized protein [Macrobrachium rosenbergii]|uniref:uncharacterized protein isoform X2 n=1 Tax=Macrobrachium rosenbergii TaxID=79674 RepID=UPI0034D685BC
MKMFDKARKVSSCVATGKAPPSYIERDLCWIFSISRLFGVWPLRNGKTADTKGPRSKDSKELNKLGVFHQEMSWLSWPPYICVFTTLFFTWSIGYQTANTVFLFIKSNLTVSDKLISLPWAGCVVVPWACNIVVLVNGGEVTALIWSWRCLEEKLCRSITCHPTVRISIALLIFYCIMGVMSFGFLVHQFINSAGSSVYFGNLVPPPWSWILHVIQHFGILTTWSGYLICEAFVMLINYHISEYYKSVDRDIGKVLKTWVSAAEEDHLGQSFHDLEMSKENSPLVTQKSIKPYRNEASEDIGFQEVKFKPAMVNLISMRVSSLGHSYESVESHSKEEFIRLWDMFEEIEKLVDEFNRLFSLIMLLTFSSYLLMVCGLLVPVMKAKPGDPFPWGYFGNAIFYVARIPMLVLCPSRVHEFSASLQETVSIVMESMAEDCNTNRCSEAFL